MAGKAAVCGLSTVRRISSTDCCQRLFGLIAFTSALRTREIGIRMALGATRESIATLLTVHATAVIAPGISIGCLGFFAVKSALIPLVYPADPGSAVPMLASSAFILTFAV